MDPQAVVALPDRPAGTCCRAEGWEFRRHAEVEVDELDGLEAALEEALDDDMLQPSVASPQDSTSGSSSSSSETSSSSSFSSEGGCALLP